jgi:hypothetical protein
MQNFSFELSTLNVSHALQASPFLIAYRQQPAADFREERGRADAEQLNCAHDYNSVAAPGEAGNRRSGKRSIERSRNPGASKPGFPL